MPTLRTFFPTVGIIVLLLTLSTLPLAAQWARNPYIFANHSGEVLQVGTTYYDQQTNRCAVPQIALASDGTVYACWTNGSDRISSTRHVYYNAVLPDGSLFGGAAGIGIESSSRAGYCTIDLARLDAGCESPVIFFHMVLNPFSTPHAAATGDQMCLSALFNFEFYTPDRVNWGSTDMESGWPHGCVSRGLDGANLVHAVVAPSVTTVPDYSAYYHGIWDETLGSVNWSGDTPRFLPDPADPDTINGITAMWARSRTSSKVSVCWIRWETGPTPEEDSIHGFVGMSLSKIVCYESTDGVTWDWSTPKWVQERALPDRVAHTFPDSYKKAPSEIYPYYDNNDHLHVAYATYWMWDAFSVPDTTHPADTSWWWASDTAFLYSYYKSDLLHWDEVNDTVTEIYEPDFYGAFRGGHALSPDGHYWVNRPSLVSTQDGHLICVWEQIIQEDDTAVVLPTDTIVFGYTDVARTNFRANSDIEAAISSDGGLTWSRPNNLTNTYTPFCTGEGDSVCWSERDPSVALTTSVIGGQEYFHLFYILDLHPGSLVRTDNPDADIATLNPVMYQRVPIDFHFEDVPSPQIERPMGNRLSSPQPNPFTDRLDVAFSLPKEGPVLVEVVDLFGRVINRLADARFPAGEHRLAWDGSTASAGVYLVRMTASGESQVRRVTKTQ